MSEKAIEQIRRILKMRAGFERMAQDETLSEAIRYSSAQEAQAAAVLIQRLLAKHKLELTDIELEAEDVNNPFLREPLFPSDYGAELEHNRVKWTEDLAGYIGYAYFCSVLTTLDNNLLFIVGRKTDVEIGKVMFLRLARTALYLMQKDRGKKFSLRSMSPEEINAYLFSPMGEVSDQAYKDSYLTGFVRGVGERIVREARRLELEAGESTALVRAAADVEKYAVEVAGGNRTEDLPTPDNLDYGALMQGMIRGKTVDLDAGGIPALNPREETTE